MFTGFSVPLYELIPFYEVVICTPFTFGFDIPLTWSVWMIIPILFFYIIVRDNYYISLTLRDCDDHPSHFGTPTKSFLELLKSFIISTSMVY